MSAGTAIGMVSESLRDMLVGEMTADPAGGRDDSQLRTSRAASRGSTCTSTRSTRTRSSRTSIGRSGRQPEQARAAAALAQPVLRPDGVRPQRPAHGERHVAPDAWRGDACVLREPGRAAELPGSGPRGRARGDPDRPHAAERRGDESDLEHVLTSRTGRRRSTRSPSSSSTGFPQAERRRCRSGCVPSACPTSGRRSSLRSSPCCRRRAGRPGRRSRSRGASWRGGAPTCGRDGKSRRGGPAADERLVHRDGSGRPRRRLPPGARRHLGPVPPHLLLRGHVMTQGRVDPVPEQRRARRGRAAVARHGCSLLRTGPPPAARGFTEPQGPLHLARGGRLAARPGRLAGRRHATPTRRASSRGARPRGADRRQGGAALEAGRTSGCATSRGSSGSRGSSTGRSSSASHRSSTASTTGSTPTSRTTSPASGRASISSSTC